MAACDIANANAGNLLFLNDYPSLLLGQSAAVEMRLGATVDAVNVLHGL
jgi:hypothetical protein